MKINLTKKQYKSLAKAVYLGNWIANASRTGQEGDKHMSEYDDIADYVFSLAKDFGFSEHYEHELEYDEEKETEVHKLISEYDEESFWEELPDRLGERDFYRKYTKEEINKMTAEERFLNIQECIIKWEEELEEYGIDRLEIKEK